MTDGSPLGVYCSDNSGSTWSNITPTNMFAFDVPNVEYMAVISVCPANISVVMAATKSLCRSTNSGQTWTEYIDIGGNPIRNIHGDHHRLVWRDGDKVYSANDGTVWTQLNTTAFPTPHIFSFSVSTYISGGSVIYACLKDEPESGNHTGKLLRVYDNGNWYECSTGLPQSGAWV